MPARRELSGGPGRYTVDVNTARIAKVVVTNRLMRADKSPVELVVAQGQELNEGLRVVQVASYNLEKGVMEDLVPPKLPNRKERYPGDDIFIDPSALKNGRVVLPHHRRGLWIPLGTIGREQG